MKQILPLASLCLLVLVPQAGLAQNNYSARFALHAKDHFTATKAIPRLCPDPTDPSVPNYSPNWDGIDCYNYTVRRPTNEFPGPHVFLTVGAANTSILGTSCGITYNPGTGPGNGIDPNFITWTGCSDGLEFPNDGGHGDFPAPDGGIRITFSTCQAENIPPWGIHVVLGAFYVYAYSEDVLRVTPNNNLLSGPEMAVTSCTGTTTDLLEITPPEWHEYLEARVHFGGDGSLGFTPCIDLPVEATTWGRLKSLYSREEGRMGEQ